MSVVKIPSYTDKINFKESHDLSGSGVTEDSVKRISEVFDRQIKAGLHPGAQLVVLKNGRVIVDQYGGYTDTRKSVPVTPTTKFLTFSVTKPLTSACIFKLVDESKVTLDSHVGEYWPEFACNGKEEITIRQVLLHQSGLPVRGFVNQLLNISNTEKISGYLAGQKPEFQPGTKTAYQYLNFGFILGEIIKRVSGKPVDDFLREKYLRPMGINNTSMNISEPEDDGYAKLCSGT
ncbi:MAG: beta-lactamase family protein, partial [Chloroflexota bacterium]